MDRIDIFDRRRKKFIIEGLSESSAYDLATALWNRDESETFDMRVCFECKNYQVDKSCKALSQPQKKMYPLRFVLQRCPQFYLKGKQ